MADEASPTGQLQDEREPHAARENTVNLESATWVPLRWPAEWRDTSLLEAVAGAGVNCLLFDQSADLAAVRARAAELGFHVLDSAQLPPDVHVVRGEWPGIRISRQGAEAVAGPTGDPWYDSNAWRVRLARLLHPGKRVWVSANLPDRVVLPHEFEVAAADSALAGGRLILTPHKDFRAWDSLGQTLRFFSTHAAWAEWKTRAVLGVVSTFTGKDEAFASELLNLTGRTHQPCRIVPAEAPIPPLAAAIYADGRPGAVLRARLLAYVKAGGLLVVTNRWGAGEGAHVNPYSIKYRIPITDAWSGATATALPGHPRFELYKIGLGRLAVSVDAAPDPYQLSADTQVLMSHRHDPLRFWNAGSLGSHLSGAPTGGALLQLVNYAARPGADPVTVRVRGAFRGARLLGPGTPPQSVRSRPVADALELYLPPIATYAGIELT